MLIDLKILNFLIVFLGVLLGGYLTYIAKEEIEYSKKYLKVTLLVLGFLGTIVGIFLFKGFLIWFLIGVLIAFLYRNIFFYIGILLFLSLGSKNSFLIYSIIFIIFGLIYGLVVSYEMNEKKLSKITLNLIQKSFVLFIPLFLGLFSVDMSACVGLGSGGLLMSLILMMFKVKFR